jgi:hypothetical protein
MIPHKGGLPHSDTWGSKPARGSPQIFAACHVLHRLLVPRHPPNALLMLTPAPRPQTSDRNPNPANPNTASTPPCTGTIHTQTPKPSAGANQSPIPRQSHLTQHTLNAPEHCKDLALGAKCYSRSTQTPRSDNPCQTVTDLPRRSKPSRSRSPAQTHRDVLRAQKRTRT